MAMNKEFDTIISLKKETKAKLKQVRDFEGFKSYDVLVKALLMNYEMLTSYNRFKRFQDAKSD